MTAIFKTEEIRDRWLAEAEKEYERLCRVREEQDKTLPLDALHLHVHICPEPSARWQGLSKYRNEARRKHFSHWDHRRVNLRVCLTGQVFLATAFTGTKVILLTILSVHFES